MPLFFGSNAIYPTSIMPTWLQYISKFNPLSYVVDAMRAMLLTGNYSNLPLDMIVLLITTFAFIRFASMALRRIIERKLRVRMHENYTKFGKQIS